MEKIYTSCSPCGGTGIEIVSVAINDEVVNEDITCRTCLGSGKSSQLSLDEDLIDFLKDMNNKIDDIRERVNELRKQGGGK